MKRHRKRHANSRPKIRRAVRANPQRRVVGHRRRHRNPEDTSAFIGRAPTLRVSGKGDMQFPRGMLRAASDPHSIYLDLGGAVAPPVGARVTRIQYDDPVKAVEAYKTIERFRHVCNDPFLVGPAQGGSVLLTSKSIAWRRE